MSQTPRRALVVVDVQNSSNSAFMRAAPKRSRKRQIAV